MSGCLNRHCATLLPVLTKCLFPQGVHIQEAELAWKILKSLSNEGSLYLKMILHLFGWTYAETVKGTIRRYKKFPSSYSLIVYQLCKTNISSHIFCFVPLQFVKRRHLMQINRYRPLKPPLWYLKVPCEKNTMLNPRKKFAQCVESFQKQTLGVTFNSKNSQLYNYSLPREDIFSSTRPESTCGLLANVVLSREKCHYQKPVR